MDEPHRYTVRVTWTGNRGVGTRSYAAYGREHTIAAAGKPVLGATSDLAFRGDAARWNPEELFVASLASCHMLWYLHLCAVGGVVVVGYEDDPVGTLEFAADKSGRFVDVVLRPRVTIAAGSVERAEALHAEAHRKCFLAASVNFPVRHEPSVRVDGARPA